MFGLMALEDTVLGHLDHVLGQKHSSRSVCQRKAVCLRADRKVEKEDYRNRSGHAHTHLPPLTRALLPGFHQQRLYFASIMGLVPSLGQSLQDLIISENIIKNGTPKVGFTNLGT